VFVFAAIVPPQEILDEIWSVAEAASAEGLVETPPGGRRKTSRRRLFGRGRAAAEPVGPVLDLARAIDVNLPMAKFGNLALHDANRLAEALGETAALWPSPRLKLGGCSTLESEADPSIWVDLEGDLDDLSTTIRGVHEAAKGLRLFVDRRVFQPRIRLGGVRPDATEAELEALLARLARFETDAWWQTELKLLTLVDQGPDLPNYKSFADIPLGPHVVH
jgi:2'-5' RNA ligase